MAELSILLQAMQEAGDAIVNIQSGDMGITRKSNNDVLTKADLLADEILKKHLLGHFPDYGWLSEETLDDERRLHCKRVWIVDPIDGTKEYSQGVDEYAISVALVEKGKPILASVFNPAKKQLFHAVAGQGAWLNNKKIHCNNISTAQLKILASRTEYARGSWRKFTEQHQIKPVGSIAYKLALIAAGHADATLSLGPKNEWDIAAGVLLVQEAGGIVTTKNNEEFLFNQREVKVNGIVATSVPANKIIFSFIENYQ